MLGALELGPEPLPMLGQFAFDVPNDPVAGVDVLGLVVVPVVAALAATAPPVTRAPETARTAAALRIGLILLTSFEEASGRLLRPVSPPGLRGV